MSETHSGSPELLALIIQASKESVSLLVGDKKKAQRLRFRIHSFRRTLHRAALRPNATPHDRALSDAADSVETSLPIPIEGPGGLWVLVVRPRDTEFLDILRRAGVKAEESVAPPEKPKEEQGKSAVDSYLDNKT